MNKRINELYRIAKELENEEFWKVCKKFKDETVNRFDDEDLQ